MPPYAWEVEKKNQDTKLAEGQTDVQHGQPPQGGGVRPSGLAGAATVTSHASGGLTSDQGVAASVGVRTPQGDDDGAHGLKEGDTVRLKGGKGSTLKVESIGADGKVHTTVVGKGASKGAKATYDSAELEPYED